MSARDLLLYVAGSVLLLLAIGHSSKPKRRQPHAKIRIGDAVKNAEPLRIEVRIQVVGVRRFNARMALAMAIFDLGRWVCPYPTVMVPPAGEPSPETEKGSA